MPSTQAEQDDYQESAIRPLRQQSAEALHDEGKLRRLFDADILGIMYGDPDKIIDANDTFLRLVGYSREELAAGRIDWWQMTPAEYHPRDAQAMEETLTSGSCTPFEKEYLGKDGRRVPVLIGAVLLKRSPLRWLCFAVDMTRRRQAEKQLKAHCESLEQCIAKRTAEARQRTEQLRALAAELVQAEQRERRRLAAILHDHLQQLLIAARMRSSVLCTRIEEPDLRKLVSEVDDLLAQSIQESRTLTVELSPPVLHQMGLAPALAWLARHMEEKHKLSVEVHADPSLDSGDEATRTFLFQAVRELLFNVVKHGRTPRARVCLTSMRDGKIGIEVADEGAGCDPARLESRGGGGFGLFSIRERLEFLGGCMQVEAAPGKGTRVVLLVPAGQTTSTADATSCAEPAESALPDVAAEAVCAPAGAVDSPSMPAAAHPLRVLLADDHPIVRKGLAELLRDQPGIEVVGEAEDGQAVLDLARRTRPDVIVMDVSMPRVSGIEATRRLSAELPQSRIVALSMLDEADVAEAMRSAGASVYLGKDSPFPVLIAAIQSFKPNRASFVPSASRSMP